MLISVRGIYRDGKIELTEKIPDVQSADVIVTFLPNGHDVNLADRGFNAEQVIELREALATFQED